jgi:hypothetical protein
MPVNLESPEGISGNKAGKLVLGILISAIVILVGLVGYFLVGQGYLKELTQQQGQPEGEESGLTESDVSSLKNSQMVLRESNASLAGVVKEVKKDTIIITRSGEDLELSISDDTPVYLQQFSPEEKVTFYDYGITSASNAIRIEKDNKINAQDLNPSDQVLVFFNKSENGELLIREIIAGREINE